jgi:hypothetical protein
MFCKLKTLDYSKSTKTWIVRVYLTFFWIPIQIHSFKFVDVNKALVKLDSL